jgi:hypothetical protein
MIEPLRPELVQALRKLAAEEGGRESVKLVIINQIAQKVNEIVEKMNDDAA